MALWGSKNHGVRPLRHGAEPFSFGDGEDGLLLLHGLTGSPHEMRPLGEELARRGFRVYCPLLPGHGTDPRDLAGLTAEVLYASAREALGRVADGRRTFVAGLSMGGLLAVLLARDEATAVSGLALLAPAFRLRAALPRAAVRLLGRAPFGLGPLGRLVIAKRGDTPAVRTESDPSYEAITLDAARALAHLQDAAWAALPRVKAPTLLLSPLRDRTVDPASAAEAAARLGGAAQVEPLPESGHVVPLDREAARAIALCTEHFAALAAPVPRAAG